ncbi:MAG: hypothetical protein IPH03_17775, partial [Tetrasphaera sp.]|nr:hypothetical protein [Tetrasphaera sp.]
SSGSRSPRHSSFGREGRRIDLAVPGVLALCVISAAFTAQAIATGFDRRYAVLRLLGTTPLGRDGLLWGKAWATLGVELLQWAVIGGVGLALGWRPTLIGLGYAVPSPRRDVGFRGSSHFCWPGCSAPRACWPWPTCSGCFFLVLRRSSFPRNPAARKPRWVAALLPLGRPR